MDSALMRRLAEVLLHAADVINHDERGELALR